MTSRSVVEWFQAVEKASDDLVVARLLLANLVGYQGKPYRSDLQEIINLMIALRMDQLSKETTQ